jgi:pimeloyl-ACP methyl ester carboxylesterase
VIVESGGDMAYFLLSANQNISESLRTKINSSIKDNGARIMRNDFYACDKFDVIERLTKINISVQIIVGDKHQITPLRYAPFLQDHLPNAEIVIIEAGIHIIFAEQPYLVNNKIQGFLVSL